MTWRQFRRYADYATSTLGVEPQNSPFDITKALSDYSTSCDTWQGDKATGESVLHEVAHAVTLGLAPPWRAGRIEAALEPLTASQEDLNEILTVAAVLAFVREHGLRVSARRLTDFSSAESMPHLSPAKVHRLASRLSRRSRARATVQVMTTMLGIGAGASS